MHIRPKNLQVVILASLTSLPMMAQNIVADGRATILMQSDKSWDGAKYRAYPKGHPELTVVKMEIPPHTTLPWHVHPIPNAAYIISGTLYVQTQDGSDQITLHAGDVLPETVDTIHRGWTEDSPVELIVFYAGVKGMPLAEKSHQ